jgi:hypothetical protein
MSNFGAGCLILSLRVPFGERFARFFLFWFSAFSLPHGIHATNVTNKYVWLCFELRELITRQVAVFIKLYVFRVKQSTTIKLVLSAELEGFKVASSSITNKHLRTKAVFLAPTDPTDLTVKVLDYPDSAQMLFFGPLLSGEPL